jgi:adenine-specific DNA-methyltransferase
MRTGLNETAMSILSGLYETLSSTTSQKSCHSLEISEAARLAGLTYVLSTRQLDTPYSFTSLSYDAERMGISRHRVSKISTEALDSFQYSFPMELSSDDTAALLGLIHAYACYSLPLAQNWSTSRKPIGAFYTPMEVADYIVSLTITPTLEKLASSASSKGLSAITEILSMKALDPACGTGVFLMSAFHAYNRSVKTAIRNALESGTSRSTLRKAGVLDYGRTIRHNLYGVDIDAGALEVADVSLRLLSQTDSIDLGDTSLGLSLKRGNSLISLRGMDGKSNHSHFFSDTDSRLPFEWEREFKETTVKGGFDFIVMNPPYERLKPNLAEFLRERLLTGNREIHLEYFSRYKERLNEDVQYFRNSGEFQLGNRYTIDTHRLFVERALHLARQGAVIGFIVPSTILGDLSSYPLRTSLIQDNQMLTVDEFHETSRLFDGVTQSVCVLTFKRGGKTRFFQARFGLDELYDLKRQGHILISAQQIEKTVGPTLAIPQVNDIGWRLMSKLHRHPSISSLNWLTVRRGELDLTLNRDCITSSRTSFRLIRGSNISRYSLIETSRSGSEFVDIKKLQYNLGASTRAGHISQPRIACQQVSNRTQRWRLKFTSIPHDVVLANSCNYLIDEENPNESSQPVLLGILNSELINWRFSLTNTNNHVSTRELMQLPLAGLESSVYGELISLLIEEVKKVKTADVVPKIEALVFALYGFSSKEARTVLGMRSTTRLETNAILDELKEISK